MVDESTTKKNTEDMTEESTTKKYWGILHFWAMFFPGHVNAVQSQHSDSPLSHITYITSSTWMRLDTKGTLDEFGIREHLTGKKMFSFGHCPNEGGGEAPARIKKKHNIYIHFLRTKKMYKLPKRRGGGGRGNLGNTREKTFFLQEVFPYAPALQWWQPKTAEEN